MSKALIHIRDYNNPENKSAWLSNIKRQYTNYQTVIDLVVFNTNLSEDTTKPIFNTQTFFNNQLPNVRTYTKCLTEFLYLTNYMLEKKDTFKNLGIEQYLKNYKHVMMSSNDETSNIQHYENLCRTYKYMKYLKKEGTYSKIPYLTENSTKAQIADYKTTLTYEIIHSTFSHDLRKQLIDYIDADSVTSYVNLMKESKIYLEVVRLWMLDIDYDSIKTPTDMFNHIYDTFFVKNMAVKTDVKNILNKQNATSIQNFLDVKKVWENIGNPIPVSKHINGLQLLESTNLSHIAINKSLQRIFDDANSTSRRGKYYGLHVLPIHSLLTEKLDTTNDVLIDGINILEMGTLPKQPYFNSFSSIMFADCTAHAKEYKYLDQKNLEFVYANYDTVDIASNTTYLSYMYAEALDKLDIKNVRILADGISNNTTKETLKKIRKFELVRNHSNIEYSNKNINSQTN